MVIAIFIYKITNDTNGKIYIGQTVRPVEQRYTRHIRDAESGILDTHFARAIRKHGSEHFKWEIIDTADSQEKLTQKEQYWIRYYDSVQSGYNETDAINKCGGNTYMSKTKEELDIIGEKIRIGKIGSKNPNSKSVKCFNIKTKEELYFDTVDDCRQFFNEKNHRFITTRVQHEICGLYKNEWKISYASEEYAEYHPKGHKVGNRILIEDIESGLVEMFDSVRAAAKRYGIQRQKMNIKKYGSEFTVDNKYKITVLS